MGQVLTLEDEPILVRTVKSLKRQMAKNQHLRNTYFNITTSFISILILFGMWIGNRDWGVSLSFLTFGIGRICLSRRKFVGNIIMGFCSIVFGVIIGVPTSGFEIPYHPLLLKLYDPTSQKYTQIFGVIVLFGNLVWDIRGLVLLKLEEWKKIKEEKGRRQEKMRGIFYAPEKTKGGGGTRRGRIGDGSGSGRLQSGDGKSRSLFAL